MKKIEKKHPNMPTSDMLDELGKPWQKVPGGYALDLPGTGCLFTPPCCIRPVYIHDFNVADGKLSQ